MIVLAGVSAWIGVTDMWADFAYVGDKVLAEDGSGSLQWYLLEQDFPVFVCSSLQVLWYTLAMGKGEEWKRVYMVWLL